VTRQPHWAGNEAVIRRRIIERDEGICYLCGRMGATTVDHVIPQSRGGTSEDHNLRAAHRSCNAMKGNGRPLPWARVSPRWR
jgi:5-methylcytosine-specific restriction endonuclease McrA